jgi:uncharacterized metal-binding protein
MEYVTGTWVMKMPELPKKKVGIISCSGEELSEGTVSRLAALKVLEQLRPAQTVTICLPLFLAGGEGDRAFARFYPTIAIDGCEKRCAARGTEMYSSKPGASIVVSELVAERGLGVLEGKRRLNAAGNLAVESAAGEVALLVDELLHKSWNRTAGVVESTDLPVVQATCSCSSRIPVQDILIHGKTVKLIALPLIFQQFYDSNKPASHDSIGELMENVKIYNSIPAGEEEAFGEALMREYASFCMLKGTSK